MESIYMDQFLYTNAITWKTPQNRIEFYHHGANPVKQNNNTTKVQRMYGYRKS